MTDYKYNTTDNKFIENGHILFETDVLKKLKRLAYLEENVNKLPTEQEMYNEMDKLFNDESMVINDTQIGWEKCYDFITKQKN